MSSPSTDFEAAGTSRLSLMAAVAVLVLIAFAPQLAKLGERMWATEHYSFFPLILLGSAVLAWKAVHRCRQLRARLVGIVGFRSPVLWICSIALLALSVAAHSPWPAGVGFLLALRATIRSLFSSEFSRRLMPAWWFLWLAVPLPLNLDRHLILNMQLLATKLASGVLDLNGIRHSLSGVVIELPGKSFFVEEACSGIQSLFAAISVTVFYSLMGQRGFWRTLLLTTIGIGWVLAANALRIIAVTVLSTRYRLPVDVGWAHEATGVAVFVLALLMIVSTDRLLLFLAPLRQRGAFERAESSSKGSRRSARPVKSLRWTIPAGIAAGALFAVLGFVQLSHAVTNDAESFILDRGEQIVTDASLPGTWNGWNRQSFEIIKRSADDVNGQISRVWLYERSGQLVAFSLDGPFTGWHDLGLCYTSQGWTVDDEVDHTAMSNAGARYDYSEMTQENAQGRNAYVVFTAFSDAGERVAPPPFFRLGVGMRFPDTAILIDRLREAITAEDAAQQQYGGVVYQTQAYIESESLLTERERKIVVELFQHLTQTLRDDFRIQASAPTTTSPSDPVAPERIIESTKEAD